MTPGEFKAWRTRLGLKQNKAAEMLGLHRRSIHDYEGAKREIPKAISLACAAIAMGITEYPPSFSSE